MSIGILFSGQGAQKIGMGKDFLQSFPHKKYYRDTISKYLGENIENICFQSNEKLNQTKYTQPALFFFESMVYSLLAEYDNYFKGFYGLSLGLYSALFATEVLSYEQLSKIICKRAEFMENCGVGNNGKMAAVFSSDIRQIEYVCNLFKNERLVQVANYNSFNQIVIGGDENSVYKAVNILKTLGIESQILPVNGAFHTDHMMKASEDMSNYFKKNNFNFKESKKKVFLDPECEDLKNDWTALLANQIVRKTNFNESIKNMYNSGISTFIEISPKKSLSTLGERILPNAKFMNIFDVRSYDEAIKYLDNL